MLRAVPIRANCPRGTDATPEAEIRRVFEDNFGVHVARGVHEVWRQLGREGIAVARCRWHG